jgi:hypothetical protein
MMTRGKCLFGTLAPGRQDWTARLDGGVAWQVARPSLLACGGGLPRRHAAATRLAGGGGVRLWVGPVVVVSWRSRCEEILLTAEDSSQTGTKIDI